MPFKSPVTEVLIAAFETVIFSTKVEFSEYVSVRLEIVIGASKSVSFSVKFKQV